MPDLRHLDPWIAPAEGLVRVIVEIPAGSRNKYAYDPGTGLFALDRPIHSSLRYPADYGFVPGTRSPDGEALDAVLLIPEPTFPGCLVVSRVVAAMLMEDEDGHDPKLLCVPAREPRTRELVDLEGLPEGLRDELAHFFTHIKDLEAGKWARVEGFVGRDQALALVEGARRAAGEAP